MTLSQASAFNQKNVFVAKSLKKYGFSHFAKKNFKKGDLVIVGFGKIIDHQTSHISIQIGVHKHYIPRKWTGRYWNHSCNPNTYVKTRTDGFPNLLALKNIKIGDEITYAYWMSELAWSKNADENNVKCKCGESKCRKNILAFSQLSQSDKLALIKSRHCAQYLNDL